MSKRTNISLQIKVLIGYIILVTVIASMTFILLHERKRLRRIETETEEIRSLRRDINIVQRHITKLAIQGESVIAWKEEEYKEYCANRLLTDSLLQILKPYCWEYVQPNQIDNLRHLLAEKETHLLKLMQNIKRQKEREDVLANQLPEVARRATRVHTVEQKKKGIAGFFGRKEEIRIMPSSKELHAFSDSLIVMQERQTQEMDIYADSLRMRNKTLNKALNELINNLDKQIQSAFTQREWQTDEAKKTSFRMFAIIIVIAVVLLMLSFFIIRSDLRNEEKIKLRLKQAIRENEDLLEMRKRIILTVSHDIRGPLGNIHNCADLASDTREKKKREVYLDDIRHSCHHILHLVNDLMDAYRINEAGDLRNDTPFYLNRFLQRISDEFSRKANVKALILYTVHENSALTVKGDADKLEQILANLLTNAIKFTPSGSIRFHTRYIEGKLYVQISDTGIGMDPETLKRIFAPFERAAQNINSEGFGLGLFLTNGLVNVLDGTMEVESKPSKGSLFRLEIPLPETDELVEDDKPVNNPIVLLPKKVLIVDDDPIQLKIAEDMLGRKGVSCTTCLNVREVVKAIGQSEYDIVLTDVQMPDTDGFGLLKLLRNSDIGNSRTVPVAVMTARSDGNSGIYEKEGFAGCIHKPFNIHALLTFLSTIMSQIRVPQTGNFDFSCLLDNTDDNGHMLSLVIIESEKEIEELRTAIKTSNRESMRKTVHRMIPVWEMLGKEYLLRDFQKHLHDTDSSDETICEHGIQIVEWIEKLIEEAKNELSKHENTDC
jgi:signal transduction histidine kinase/DNA-binding response OmpR family regulator